MADIFLSYTRKDKKFAENLKDALESHDWQVWWDLRIRHGLDFVDVIQEEIRQAGRVVVMWSVTSVKSNFVRDEAREAVDDQQLVSVVIDGVRTSRWAVRRRSPSRVVPCCGSSHRERRPHAIRFGFW